jgi:hypothetical protein
MDTQRNARIARALQIRIDLIVSELRSCERRRAQAYKFADHMLDEFDRLAEQRFVLTRALWRVQDRLGRAAFRRNRQEREDVAA